jgi:dTDP-4-dehydrorhamnose reductase
MPTTTTRPTKTRVLVTGGEGMLGSEFAREDQDFEGFDIKALGKQALDVRDLTAMHAQGGWIDGGWIIHCAAMVDVEGCARDPDAARAIIVDGTRNAVALAKATGARLLYPQSFLVYDGATNPIPEEDSPRPLSLYGQMKWEAEQIVREALDDALVIRMAGFFGGGRRDKNFVGRIIPVIRSAIDRGAETFEVGDRVWQPTWTKDLAFNALHVMARGGSGVYQMACLGEAAFHEIAHEIVVALGWSDRIRIVPVSASAVAQSELGRRPDRAVLSCERLTRENLNLQRDWRSTLHAYLALPFFDQYRLET